MTSITSWQRHLPRHWKVRRLKHVAHVAFSNVDKKSYENGTPIRLCNYTDVYNNEAITAGMDLMEATATPREIGRFGLRRGDVLVTKDSETWNDIAIPALVAEALPEVVCGYHLALLRPAPAAMSGEYLLRALQTSGVKEQFHVAATGVTRFGLGQGDLRNAILPVPPLPTQRAIADFLDRKTRAIDELIRKKERLIELLQEKRQALITQTVTKGLDPDVPMKESGVRWLGEIPAHWEVKRLKHLSPHVTVGIVVTPSKYYADTGVPALRSLNVTAGSLSDQDLVYLSPEGHRLHVKSALRVGDLVAVRTGKPGATAVVDARFAESNCVDLIIIRQSRRFDSDYLCYLMNSAFAHAQYESGSEGALQLHFNIETAENLLLPTPPVAEQRALRDALRGASHQLDTARARLTRQIECLHEYRQAKISAAVTGQLDVHEEAGIELPGAQAG